MAAEDDPEKASYQQGSPVASDDNSLDPSEFEEQVQQGDDDEHFVDEGNDFNFDVIDVRNRRSFTTRRCKLVAAVVMLGLAVALAVVFAGRGSKEASADGAQASVTLEEPPADLDTTCSFQALADDGTEKCMEHCERAECCDFPANLPLSCLQGNQQKCLVYHAACSHLTADSYDPTRPIPSSIPPAPSNLAELCTPDSLKTVDGFTGCHEACKHAECCYEDNMGTCTHDECAGYAPCLTLAATDHVHESIPVTIEHACATDNLASMEGRAECRQACSHALCCFSPTPDPQETACLHEDTTFCNQYAKCNDLESIQPVEATPEEIQLTCQDTEDVHGHISLCELVCERGACCFSDDGCDPLSSGIDCGDFAPCRKVFVDDGNNGKEEDDDVFVDDSEPPYYMDKYKIDSACEANMVAEVVHVPDQSSLCEEVCAAGTCCFDKATTCDVPDPERFCTIYSACSKLFPNDEEESENPPVDEGAIKAACQKEDLTDCETLCNPGACCFDGDVCDVPHPERYCAHFGYCDVLDEEEDDDVENGNPPVDANAIQEACQKDDLTDCQALCKQGDCCVVVDGCNVPDPIKFCEDFDPCDALDFDDDDEYVDEDEDETDYQDIVGDDENVDESWVDEIGDGQNENPPVDSEAIKEACQKKDDLSECQALCDPGDCCVDGSGCEVPDPEKYCENYNPCDVLDEDDDDEDDLEEDEDVDESWVDELGQGDNEDGGTGEPDDLIVEIMDVDGTIVGADVLHTACAENSANCETLCMQGACCFGDGCPDIDDEALYCDAFSVCSQFYQNTDGEQVDESWVDEVVGAGVTNSEPEDMIIEIADVDGTVVGEDELRTACMTDPDSVQCQTLCKQGKCCFEGGCDMPDSDRFCVAFGVCRQYYPGE